MRPSPVPVFQSNQWWCWAACLEILNREHPEKFPPPVRTQAQWMEAMQAAPAASQLLNAQGGLNVHYLPAVLTTLGMQSHYWPGPPPAAGTNIVDPAFVEQQLHLSYLLGLYTVPGGSHFIVIHGVDAQRLYYFNPWSGVGSTSAPLAQVQAGRLVIGWKP